MKYLAIALLNLRRTFRKRSNVFYILLIPFVMILLLGLMFGERQQFRVGVLAPQEPLSERLVAALASDPSVEVVAVDTEEDLRTRVERGQVDGGLHLPADYGERLSAGADADVRYLMRSEDLRGTDLGALVRAAVSQEAAELRAARFTAEESQAPLEEGLLAVERAEVRGVDVSVETPGEAAIPAGVGSFYLSAPPLLLLYTFLTALTTAVGIVETRGRGISRRMYATPTGAWTLVLGEMLGRLLIAFVQALVIMAGTALLFGVSWGDPLGAAALIGLFSLAAGGAAMLLGSALRSEGTVNSLALLLGLGLAVVGGTVIPLETLSGGMRTLAYLTPHAWGYEGFAELVRHGGGLTDILPQLGVLAAYAAVLLLLGVWAMRRALTR